MLSAFCFYSIVIMTTASVSGSPKENGNDNDVSFRHWSSIFLWQNINYKYIYKNSTGIRFSLSEPNN